MERLFSKAVFDVISISPTVGVLSIPAVHGVVNIAIVVGLVSHLRNASGKVTGLYPYF